MTVVDTSVWLDWFAGRENPYTAWLREALGPERLGLTDLNLCELLQGARSERQAAELDHAVSPFDRSTLPGLAWRD